MKDRLKSINKKYIMGSIIMFISILIITSVIWGIELFGKDVKPNHFSFKSTDGRY